jgi:hypothetical protein
MPSRTRPPAISAIVFGVLAPALATKASNANFSFGRGVRSGAEGDVLFFRSRSASRYTPGWPPISTNEPCKRMWEFASATNAP